MPKVIRKTKSTRGKVYTCVQCGKPIEPGEQYSEWSFYRSRPTRMHTSHGSPRPSQLTRSKMGGVYAAVETVEDELSDWKPEIAEDGSLPDASTVTEALDTCAEEVRAVADEYEESADSIEQVFQGSPTAEECREKAEDLNTFADALESAKSSIRDEPENEAEIEAWADEVKGEAEGALQECP